MKSCCKTSTSNYGALALRLGLGIMMLPHGLQKMFGMFGGGGFSGTMGFLTGMGIPSPIAFLVILGESLGALALIVGFCTRFCAASLGLIMLGAILMVHGGQGFLGGDGAIGYQWHVVYLAGCIALVLQGGGAWSIDAMLGGCCDKDKKA